MELELLWHEPLPLREGYPGEGLTYACDDIGLIPEQPGIYVFARRFGHKVDPLYVGRSLNLRGRIVQHLKNSVELLNKIKEEEAGQRVVLIGEFIGKRGQQPAKATRILERAYIESALTTGHELLNDKGTRTPTHKIVSSGRKASHKPFPRRMNVKRQKKE